jgi:hypothetical protein
MADPVRGLREMGRVTRAGAYLASLTADHRTALREQCQRLLPPVRR